MILIFWSFVQVCLFFDYLRNRLEILILNWFLLEKLFFWKFQFGFKIYFKLIPTTKELKNIWILLNQRNRKKSFIFVCGLSDFKGKYENYRLKGYFCSSYPASGQRTIVHMQIMRGIQTNLQRKLLHVNSEFFALIDHLVAFF